MKRSRQLLYSETSGLTRPRVCHFIVNEITELKGWNSALSTAHLLACPWPSRTPASSRPFHSQFPAALESVRHFFSSVFQKLEMRSRWFTFREREGEGKRSLEAECRGQERMAALRVAPSPRSVASPVPGIDCDSSCSLTNSASCVGLLISVVISCFVDEA